MIPLASPENLCIHFRPLMKFLVCLVALLVTLPVARGDGNEYEARTFTAPEGGTLPYRLLQPAEHKAKVPLVLFLHGAGERGDNNSDQLRHGAPLFLQARDRFPCYVAAPQCPADQKWVDVDWSKPSMVQPAEPSAPMKLVLGLLDALPKEFPDIDLDRIYVTGLSMGGFGTWDLITRFPQRFAAAAPICGGADSDKAAAVAQTPIWTFHGNVDPVVTVEQTRRMIGAIKDAGGEPLYTEYPNCGHDSWTNAYQEPELLPWMFAQTREQKPVSFETVAGHYAQPPTNLFPGQGPVQPGIWFRKLWLQVRTNWAQSAAANDGAVVFLGDSITQGWATLANDFAGIKVANRGISGDTTRGVRFRLKEDVLDVHPRAVVFLIGTNDLELGAGPETAVENIKAILAELRASNPKLPVLVCKVMPSSATKNRPAAKIQAINTLVDEIVAADPLLIRVDTYSIFADAEGNAKAEEFPDLLHPNGAGYAKWKSALQPAFTKLGIVAPAQ